MKRALFAATLIAAFVMFWWGTADTTGDVHHPDCPGIVKDIPAGVPTPVAGVVWVKAGPDHVSVGFQPAGYVAPDPFNGKDVSHVDVCPDTTTTEVPPSTSATSLPESTVTTSPPSSEPPPSTGPSTSAPTSTSPPSSAPSTTSSSVPPSSEPPSPTTTGPPASTTTVIGSTTTSATTPRPSSTPPSTSPRRPVVYLFTDCDGLRVKGEPEGELHYGREMTTARVRLEIDGVVHRFKLEPWEERSFSWDRTQTHRWEMRIDGVVTDEGIAGPCRNGRSTTSTIVALLPATGPNSDTVAAVALLAAAFLLIGGTMWWRAKR